MIFMYAVLQCLCWAAVLSGLGVKAGWKMALMLIMIGIALDVRDRANEKHH